MTDSSVLNGLVLAGGKSVRMGTDKGAIRWHGKEQRYHMADLLTPVCNQVMISCRPGQQASFDPHYAVLPDAVEVPGPLAGILTAFSRFPGTAWFVTACDLPLLDTATLLFLQNNRRPDVIATTFRSPHDGHPEPLITIWEPAAFPLLQDFVQRGITCPRKVLINSNALVLDAPFPDALLNANTPADAEKVQQLLNQQQANTHA